MKSVKHISFDFSFPQTEPPSWKNTVPRWYQLDAYSYGLAEGAFRWRALARPELILLASPLASNETDQAFVEGGSGSPAKFAHTLPNIRCSPFCQVMEWSGPVLCLQRDPHTQLVSLIEAFEMAQVQYSRVWILSVIRREFQYKVHCLEVGNAPGSMTMAKRLEKLDSLSVQDDTFMGWLEKPEDTNFIFSNYEIKKESFK